MKIGDFPPIKIVKPESAPGSAEPGKSTTGAKSFDFVPGQILKGRVLSFCPDDGRVLLDIEGSTLTATSQTPLEAGEELWLEVRQGGESPWLAFAGKKKAVQDFLRLVMTEGLSFGGAVKKMIDMAAADQQVRNEILLLLEGVRESSVAGSPDIEKLIKMMSLADSGAGLDAGGNFPARLGKLLQDVMVLIRNLEYDQPLLDKTTLPALEKFSRMLDSFQTVNSQPFSSDQNSFFLFPCFFSGGESWGQWMFSLDEKKERASADQACYALHFFLEMSRLGEVHLKLNGSAKVLQGDFYLADSAVLNHIEEKLPELSLALQKLGYGLVRFRCHIQEENLLHELREVLQEKAQLKTFAMVDLRV